MKFNKTNVTKIFIDMQDNGDLTSNVMATRAIKKLKLRNLHQKITGNPDSAYNFHKVKTPKWYCNAANKGGVIGEPM